MSLISNLIHNAISTSNESSEGIINAFSSLTRNASSASNESSGGIINALNALNARHAECEPEEAEPFDPASVARALAAMMEAAAAAQQKEWQVASEGKSGPREGSKTVKRSGE